MYGTRHSSRGRRARGRHAAGLLRAWAPLALATFGETRLLRRPAASPPADSEPPLRSSTHHKCASGRSDEPSPTGEAPRTARCGAFLRTLLVPILVAGCAVDEGGAPSRSVPTGSASSAAAGLRVAPGVPTIPAASAVEAVPRTPEAVFPSELVLPWGAGSGQVGYVPAAPERAAFGPRSLASGPSGELWILDAVNERLVRLAADGSWLGAVPAPPAADDLVVDSAGRLYVLSLANRTLSVVAGDGSLVDTRPLPPAPRRVRGLAMGAAGEVLLVNAFQETFELGRPGAWTRWPELLLTRAEGLPSPLGGPRAAVLLRDGQARLLLPSPSGGKEPAGVALQGTAGVASVELVCAAADGSIAVVLERFVGPLREGVVSPVQRSLVWFDAQGVRLGERAVATQPGVLSQRRLAVGPGGRIHEMSITDEGLRLSLHTLEVQP